MRHRAVDSCREAHCRGVRREQDDSAVARCSRPRLVSGAIGQQNSCVEPDRRREASQRLASVRPDLQTVCGIANQSCTQFSQDGWSMVAWQKGTLFDSQTTERRRTYAGSPVERVRPVHKIHRADVNSRILAKKHGGRPGAQLQLTLQSCALVTGAVRARAAPSESGTAPMLLHPLGAPP